MNPGGQYFDIQPDVPVGIGTAQAVATVLEKSHDELHPLEDSLDTDALDQIIRESQSETQVEFEYEGCEIRIKNNRILVSELND